MLQQLQNLKGRDVFLLSLLLIILLGLGWYYLLFSTKKAEIDMARQQLDTLKIQVDAARPASAELPALREEVARLEVQRDELIRALPATARIGAVLDEIRSNVLASGSDLNGVTQSGAQIPNLPAGVRPIGISLNLAGQFSELYGVLRSLEAMNRFSTINSLSLTMGEADSFDPDLGGQIGVTIYTFDPATAAPATTPAGAPGATPAAPTAPAAPAAPAGGNS